MRDIKVGLSYTAQTQKIPKRRHVYKNVVADLKNGVAANDKIAKDHNVTRQTVYRIKKDNGINS
jgi:DNA invertase Pin-like site-specific DNA recombinase